jgi:type VI secretion system protein ImpF
VTPAGSSERTVRASLLDRLIDLQPRAGADPTLSRAETERRFRQSVLRDVEWLLNTRRSMLTADRRFEEVRASVYHYGLPDVTSLSADSTEARGYLLRRIEEAIRLFEPRLVDVRVALVEGEAGSSGRRHVRVRVEGTLLMDPDPERVVFDTLLETSSGTFTVEE